MKAKDIVYMICKNTATNVLSDISLVTEPGEHISKEPTEDYIQMFFNQLTQHTKIAVSKDFIILNEEINKNIEIQAIGNIQDISILEAVKGKAPSTTTNEAEHEISQLDQEVNHGYWIYMAISSQGFYMLKWAANKDDAVKILQLMSKAPFFEWISLIDTNTGTVDEFRILNRRNVYTTTEQSESLEDYIISATWTITGQLCIEAHSEEDAQGAAQTIADLEQIHSVNILGCDTINSIEVDTSPYRTFIFDGQNLFDEYFVTVEKKDKQKAKVILQRRLNQLQELIQSQQSPCYSTDERVAYIFKGLSEVNIPYEIEPIEYD